MSTKTAKKEVATVVKGEVMGLTKDERKMVTTINTKLNTIDRNMSEVSKLIAKGIAEAGERGFQSALARKTGLSKQLISKYKGAGDVFLAHEEFDCGKVTVSQALLIGRIETANKGVLPENVTEMTVKELEAFLKSITKPAIEKVEVEEEAEGEAEGEEAGGEEAEIPSESKTVDVVENAIYYVPVELVDELKSNLKMICETWEANRVLNMNDVQNICTLYEMVCKMSK